MRFGPTSSVVAWATLKKSFVILYFLLCRKGPAPSHLRHDDEIPGPQAGSLPQDLQHHRETEGQEAPSYWLKYESGVPIG